MSVVIGSQEIPIQFVKPSPPPQKIPRKPVKVVQTGTTKIYKVYLQGQQVPNTETSPVTNPTISLGVNSNEGVVGVNSLKQGSVQVKSVKPEHV